MASPRRQRLGVCADECEQAFCSAMTGVAGTTSFLSITMMRGTVSNACRYSHFSE